MSKRMKVICALGILWIIIGLIVWQSQAFAIETNVLGVVTGGTIRTNSTYYAFGGTASPDNPAFENRYVSSYSATGSAGFAQQNSFGGSMAVKEQFEVMSGFGSFSTKAGTGVLVNVPRETTEGQTPIIDGTARWNAAGFAGSFAGPGVVLSTFGTVGGLKATSEIEAMNGQFRAGAIQMIQTGSNQQPIQPPTTIEYKEARWALDGKFQFKVEIIFPK